MTSDRKCGRCAASAGFTLLEALVAMALTGVIVATLATITSQWLPNWNRGLARVQQADRLALGLEILAADFSAAAFVPKGRDSQDLLFDGRERSATLVRTALSPNAPPSLEVVTIGEARGQDGPMVVRRTKPFLPATQEPSEGAQAAYDNRVILFQAPYALQLAYAGADRVWHDTWPNSATLPRAIKLTIYNAVRKQILLSTAAQVHAELPARCVTAKSVVDCLSRRRQADQDPGQRNDGKLQ